MSRRPVPARLLPTVTPLLLAVLLGACTGGGDATDGTTDGTADGATDGTAGSAAAAAGASAGASTALAGTGEGGGPQPASSDASGPSATSSTPATAAAGAAGCPAGAWAVDGPGLRPFYDVAAPPGVSFEPGGRFVVTIAPPEYSAVSEGFEMALSAEGLTGDVSIDGGVSGEVTADAATIRFTEASNTLSGSATMNGEPFPAETVLASFRNLFGAGTHPYRCEGGNLVVSYDTPAGPADVIFSPA